MRSVTALAAAPRGGARGELCLPKRSAFNAATSLVQQTLCDDGYPTYRAIHHPEGGCLSLSQLTTNQQQQTDAVSIERSARSWNEAQKYNSSDLL